MLSREQVIIRGAEEGNFKLEGIEDLLEDAGLGYCETPIGM